MNDYNDYIERDRMDAHPSVLPSDTRQKRECPQCGGDHDAMDRTHHPGRAALRDLAIAAGLVGGVGSDE